MAVVWDPPYDFGSAITHYTLEWSYNAEFDKVNIIDKIRQPRHVFECAQPDTWYHVRVAASNCCARGLFSVHNPKTGDGCLKAPATAPDPPFDITAENLEGKVGSVYVKWRQPPCDGGRIVSRYRVACSTEPSMKNANFVVQKAARACKITDLVPEMIYFFDVVAINSMGESSLSGRPASLLIPAVPPAQYILPKKPAKPSLSIQLREGEQMVTESKRWLLASLSDSKVEWTCPESYDVKRGFIFSTEHQTHPIESYSVRLMAFKEVLPDFVEPDPALAESVQLLENHVQIRNQRSMPLDSGNTVRFGELRPGRVYYACVQAHSLGGSSPWSAASPPSITPPGLPERVESLEFVGRTADSLTLEWHMPEANAEEVTSFVLRWAEPSFPLDIHDRDVPSVRIPVSNCAYFNPNSSASAIGDVGICRCTITELRHAREYVAELCAGCALGDGPWVRSVVMRTAPTIPSPPGCAQGVPSDATRSSVTFKWDEPADDGGEEILGYEVCWVSVDHVEPIPANAEALAEDARSRQRCTRVGADQRIFVVQGVVTGNSAIPIIRAWNCVGDGKWSRIPARGLESEALATAPCPPADTSVPPVLARVAAMDHRPYWLTAHWTCPACNGNPILSFHLRITQVGAGTNDDAGDPGRMTLLSPSGHAQGDIIDINFDHTHHEAWQEGQELSLECVHAHLKPGAEYMLQVRARSSAGDADGWGRPSTTEQAPPDLPDRPDAPTSPWQRPATVDILWKAPASNGARITKCALQYSTSPEMEDAKDVVEARANELFAERTVMVTDLFEVNTPYYFKVRLYNSVGWSMWSTISKGYITGACRPSPPKNIHAIHVTPFSIRFQWDYPDDHGSEVVEYELIACEDGRSEDLDRFVVHINSMGDAVENLEEVVADWERRHTTAFVKERAVIPVEILFNRKAPAFSLEGLAGGLNYSVAARARNSCGWSDLSSIVRPVSTLCAAPDVCPLVTLAESTQSCLSCSVRLPYDNGAKISVLEMMWFRIEGPVDRHLALGGAVVRKNLGASQGEASIEVPTPGPEPARPGSLGGACHMQISDLEPGAEYEVQVRAVNLLGAGEYSLAARLKTAPGLPDAPARLRQSSRTSVAAGVDSNIRLGCGTAQVSRGGRTLRFPNSAPVVAGSEENERGILEPRLPSQPRPSSRPPPRR
eukprot:TRINITY_DN17330_c0_g2_i1.p1 TRINITY_DN17330_c0_g2~~TRINITY_DN17330_c0_g2_i1.p1  ORF type:complete len:1288 (-),score=121.04 TRINITY_DN17330_c0_g2_i1:299-3808(-)